MIRDVEMELSLWEMLLAVKRYWVMVFLCMVVCAALGGVLGYVRSSSGSDDAVNTAEMEEVASVQREHAEYVQSSYDENQKMMKDSEGTYKEIGVKLREEYARLKGLYDNHPLLKSDATAMTAERLTICFDGGNHDSMMYDWIRSADDASVFGDAAGDLGAYRDDLILINGASMGSTTSTTVRFGASQSGFADETSIVLMAVDGFDAKKGAAYLKSFISSKANATGLRVKATSESTLTGDAVAKYISDFRIGLASRMDEIQSRLTNMYNLAITEVAAPAVDPGTAVAPVSEGVSLKGLLKYILIGLVLGIVAGAALAIFLTLRKGCAISRRQVEESFGLELLSDMAGDSGADGAGVSLDILNANLDVMVGDGSAVMLLSSFPDDGGEAVSGCVSKWNEGGTNREFIAGRDIIDDSVTIDALSGVEGILLCVRIGESKLTDIQRVLIRAKKLGKSVLGYVVM